MVTDSARARIAGVQGGRAVRDAPAALGRLVPDPESFVRGDWTAVPTLWRAEVPGRYRDLFDLEALEYVVNTVPLRPPLFSMVRDGRPIDPRTCTRSGTPGEGDGLLDPGRVITLLEQGASLNLYRASHWWKPLRALCDRLEEELTHPVDAVVFATPTAEQGLGLHRDAHEVFVLQVHGSKHWSVYQRPAGVRVEQGEVTPEEAGTPVLEEVLSEGDCLHVPRGSPHVARSVDQPSVHVSVIVRPVTAADVLSDLSRQALRQGEFDRALPPNFARRRESGNLLEEALEELVQLLPRGSPEVLDLGITRFRRERRGTHDGRIARLMAAGDGQA